MSQIVFYRIMMNLKLNKKIILYLKQAQFLLIPLSFFLITACPDPPETTDCGAHQIEVNGDCECEEGYHWDEDQTKCLMDTTSHNFTWVIDTLCINGSYLNDVWIVDENNIWVVGNIETDSGEYNAAHWGGDEWELLGLGSNTLDLNSIFYFSDNDIWICSGIPRHWNGQEWIRYHLWDMGVLGPNDGGVTEVWGTSSSNIYFVGREGSIVHYNGSAFTKLESGTNVDLKDIWGVEKNNDIDIWISGYVSGPPKTTLIKIENNRLEKLWEDDERVWIIDHDSLSALLSTVWTNDPDSIYIGTQNGFYRCIGNTQGKAKLEFHQPGGFVYKMRGNGKNDIFLCGAFGTLTHYNGKSFYTYTNFGNSLRFKSIFTKGNFITIVGEDNNNQKGIIVRGYRNN